MTEPITSPTVVPVRKPQTGSTGVVGHAWESNWSRRHFSLLLPVFTTPNGSAGWTDFFGCNPAHSTCSRQVLCFSRPCTTWSSQELSE